MVLAWSCQDGGNEVSRAGLGWAAQNLLRRPAFDDLTLVHEQHTTRHFSRKAKFMRHDDHTHPRSGEVAHHGKNFAHQFGIQCGSGFIEQHQCWFHCERARDSHALLLTTRELDWVRITLICKPHTCEQLARVTFGLFAIVFQYLNWPLGDILESSHVWEQIEALEHHAGRPSLPGDLTFRQRMELVASATVSNQFIVDPQSAAINYFQLIDTSKESALPGSGRTYDAEYFASGDLEIDPF